MSLASYVLSDTVDNDRCVHIGASRGNRCKFCNDGYAGDLVLEPFNCLQFKINIEPDKWSIK